MLLFALCVHPTTIISLPKKKLSGVDLDVDIWGTSLTLYIYCLLCCQLGRSIEVEMLLSYSISSIPRLRLLPTSYQPPRSAVIIQYRPSLNYGGIDRLSSTASLTPCKYSTQNNGSYMQYVAQNQHENNARSLIHIIKTNNKDTNGNNLKNDHETERC